ncbi:biotin--[acetyl-CoA-carboxylase] ligase [Lutibacter sp. B2]|nr:biotin--[acetyl-CoA-carboxylase] ligase [Lutibacter sp. B2]
MKKQILEVLREHKDTFVSGEDLSKKIGVSRTAVWKHMKQLKEDGYQIESVSRKGYHLVKEGDTLDPNVLEVDLKNEYIGKKIYHFESVDSTNNVAKKMAHEGAIEGTVVIAEEQTKGRGRLGREWLSPKGDGIWMSIILRPEISPSEAMIITQVTAAAITLAMRKILHEDIGIKWPNDIVLHKKKVCGILTEMSAELDSMNFIVVGMGVNANVDIEDFPEEVKDKAISMKTYFGEAVSRKDLTMQILHEFEALYSDFAKNGDIKKTIDICKKYSVTLGKRVKIISRQKEIEAEAIDLTKDGQLLIRHDNGEIEEVLSGEVSVRGLYEYV